MSTSTDLRDDGKLDLVPMIDCVMLLLLFFILTTRFVRDDQALSALLPTNQGSTAIPSPVVPQDLNVIALPAELPAGADVKACTAFARGHDVRQLGLVAVRVGANAPLMIDNAMLRAGGAVADAELTRLHAYLDRLLTTMEEPGDRRAQRPVTLHCYSGLPWSCGIALYDALRAYEGRRQGTDAKLTQEQLEAGRSISFAGPRLRDADHERGDELFELAHLR